MNDNPIMTMPKGTGEPPKVNTRSLIAGALAVVVLAGGIFYVAFISPITVEEDAPEEPITEEGASDAILIREDCTLVPATPRLKERERVRFRNTDSVAHRIAFAQHIVDVEPGKDALVTVFFANGPGSYGYTCDGRPEIKGVIIAE